MSTTDQSLVDKLKKPNSFPAMLEKFRSEIARALPKHLNPDRMSRIALTAFRRNPKLGECEPKSVFAAVIQASQLGLEPDTLGRAYLIPHKVNKKVGNNWLAHYECQFIPGWKGLVELMNRSGHGTAWTGAVYAGDVFEFALGDSPFVKHIPGGEYAEDRLSHVYAVGRPRGCEWPIIEVWTIARVKAHRDRYNKVGEKHYSYENMEMYARKVALLQVLKYMPLSPDLITTMELSHAADAGKQGLTIDGVLDGSWIPPAPAEKDNDTEGSALTRKIKAASKKLQQADAPSPPVAPPQDAAGDYKSWLPPADEPPRKDKELLGRAVPPAGMVME